MTTPLPASMRSWALPGRDRARRRARGFVGSAAMALPLVALFVACAAQPETYWTRGQSTEKDFRLASRWCSEKAEDDGAGLGSRSCTTTSAYGGGTYCRNEDPNSFDNQQRRKNLERRSYSQCMEKRGWTANTKGDGFKGVY